MTKVPILFLSLAFLSPPCSLYSQEEPRELFSKAYALFSAGELSRAEELFRKTLDQDYLLSDYSLFYLGQISTARGSYNTARAFVALLKKSYPRSVWVPQAELEMAKISLAEKDYPRAKEELRALRADRNKREMANQILYLLAQAHELQGEPKEAFALYQELRRASPLSSWAAKARKEISRLRQEMPELFDLATADSLSAEGDLLLRERQYPEAERVYHRLLELSPNGISRPAALTRLANVYRATRRRQGAIPILSEIVRDYPQSPETPNALYHLAQIYWNLDENLKALDHFRKLKERYPKSTFLGSADLASARIYESLGKPAEAILIYRDFARNFPDSQLREEAAWRLAWIDYLQGDYDNAYAAFMRLATNITGDRFTTAALYWQARTAAKLGSSEEAQRIFLQIVNGQDDSYYKVPAARALEKMGGLVEEKKSAGPTPLEPTPSLSPDLSFHLTRTQELARIALNNLAVAELDEIRNQTNDTSLRLLLMREYARNGAYGKSVSIANQFPAFSDELQRYRYPLAYWEKIHKLAEERELDPYLVLALIRQESLFDPKALSPASAFGLMQLLPSTAARTAKQMGLASPQPEKLFDPDLNLMLGTRHLKDLLERYSNNPVKAIAAYNAGENAVARWENQISAHDEDEFIESIPYAETRLYVKLVLRNHLNYRRIYSSQPRSEPK